MPVRLRNPAVFAFSLALLFAVPGCAEFAELISFDVEGAKSNPVIEEERSRLWEMTLMAGRYGVMLGQAREILRLPEPKTPMGDTFPSANPDDRKQREALAAYQANVASEFAADVAVACKGRRVPKKLRAMACDQKKKLPAAFSAPVAPDMQALAMRNDDVGDFVMPWWNAVCATAPKPKDDGDVPPCVME